MRRPVSWLAGRSTMHTFPDRSSGRPFGASASRYPLTVAGTAVDWGAYDARTTFPINPFPGTGAIMLQESQALPRRAP